MLSRTPSFSPGIDVPVALVCYVASLAGTLLWVRRSDQQNVEATFETTRRVCIRLAILVLSLFAATYLVDVAFWVVVVVLPLLSLVVVVGDSLGILGLATMGVAYLLKEYVLGFPELILAPPKPIDEANTEGDHSVAFVGRSTITVSPLRPIGEIELDGVQMAARSDCGDYIPRDAKIVVIGSQSGTLIVREAAEAT